MPDHDITTLYKEDDAYPKLLAEIADPPEKLHCRGDVSLLNSFCIGVVGTRRASDYGRQATADIAGNLAASGLTIVSGLASGIDTAAHRAALDAKGKTIAVFGTGIDDESIFPKENVRLAHEIVASGGLLVSEYDIGTSGQRWTFPTRNRIISGLSHGTVVIEADKDSGSLITAKSALDQNREVFSLPGSIYWPRSVGTNWLIAQGARIATSAADILECFRLSQKPLPLAAVSTEDPTQHGILALLREHGPLHMDELSAKSGIEASKVMVAIALLELHNLIRHQGAGIYSLL